MAQAPRRARSWSWLDEATAVVGERLLLGDNPERARFASRWIDYPDVSLDKRDRQSAYGQGLFIEALLAWHTKGPILLRDTWRAAADADSPVEVISDVVGGPSPFSSARPHVDDFFGSVYAPESYILKTFGQDVLQRYGRRRIKESFHLQPNSGTVITRETLDHLACCFFDLSFLTRIQRPRWESTMKVLSRAH